MHFMFILLLNWVIAGSVFSDCLDTEIKNLLLDQSNANQAKEAGLVYLPDNAPGYSRRVTKSDVTYFHENRQLKDPDIIARLNSLSVPLKNGAEWFSINPKNHILAKSKDTRGRDQYVYHPDWIAYRANRKYRKAAAFGLALVKIRDFYHKHVSPQNLTAESVHGAALWLMDTTAIRVGNEIYARENETFGLTTLRKEHVKFKNNNAVLSFVGKASKSHDIVIENASLVAMLTQLKKSGIGPNLFQFKEGDKWQSVTNDSLNKLIKHISYRAFSAKDFRTWSANALAMSLIMNNGPPQTKQQAVDQETMIVKEISEHLGNTPAVAKSSYISPSILKTIGESKINDSKIKDYMTLGLTKSEATAVFVMAFAD